MMNDIMPKIMITVRLVLFVVALGAGVIILFVGTQAALAASTKDIAIVEGSTLTVGDIFDNAGSNADYVLGPAPQPGKDMVLNARTLYRIASALKIDWRPENAAQQVVVRRAATLVSPDVIEEALTRALEGQPGLNDKFTMTISGGLDAIVLPQNETPDVEVTALAYDSSRDTFTASLAAPSKKNPIKTMTVVGQLERILSVPVLKSALRNGDIIGAHDIEWVDIPARNTQSNMLLAEKDVIGLTPRRVAMAGKPLLTGELQSPTLVTRGDEVTIVFADGPLLLSTKGKAMQTGAKGDPVRVTNINSNKSFDAFVTGSREVTVR